MIDFFLDRPFLSGVIFLGSLFVLFSMLQLITEIQKCEDVSLQASVQTKYSYWSGCYVKDGAVWVPIDRWRHLK